MDQENNLGGQNQGLTSQVPFQNPVTPSQSYSKKKLITLLVISVVILFLLIVFIFLKINKRSDSNDRGAVSPTSTQSEAGVTPAQKEVMYKLVLADGVDVPIPEEHIAFRYESGERQEENCIDCISTTDIYYEINDDEQMITFRCGGYAGICETEKEAGGFRMVLLETSNESEIHVSVYFKK